MTKKQTKNSKTTSKEAREALKLMEKIAQKNTKNQKTRIYKEPNKTEEETVINVLYWKEIISIYTTNVELQKNLRKVLGNPTQEDMRGRSIVAGRWDIPMKDKQKLSQVLLKVNIFEL